MAASGGVNHFVSYSSSDHLMKLYLGEAIQGTSLASTLYYSSFWIHDHRFI